MPFMFEGSSQQPYSTLPDDELGRFVAKEMAAHALRYDILGRSLTRDIGWAILIGAMAARLRSEQLIVADLAAFEKVSQKLILRWASILAQRELISVWQEATGRHHIALRSDGEALVIDCLMRRNQSPT